MREGNSLVKLISLLFCLLKTFINVDRTISSFIYIFRFKNINKVNNTWTLPIIHFWCMFFCFQDTKDILTFKSSFYGDTSFYDFAGCQAITTPRLQVSTVLSLTSSLENISIRLSWLITINGRKGRTHDTLSKC